MIRIQSLVLSAVFLVHGVALTVDLSDEDRAWKVRPITKVVNLLKDMSAKIQEEAKTDEVTFDKLACWCETNDNEKTQAIKQSTRRIESLESAISGLAAEKARLQVDTKQLLKEFTEKGDSLAKATEIRKKEETEFRNTEKDMIGSITSLKNAVLTLGKANGESLLQVRQLIRHHMEKFKQLFPMAAASSPVSLLQRESSVAPSGAIFGIMKGMKETFETNLVSAQKDEEQSKEEYDGLKATKEEEIQAADSMKDSKTTELSQAEKKLAQSKQDLDDTSEALSSDTETLRNLKLTCQQADHEWGKRQEVRNQELQAISDTIKILTDDDAKETMDRATTNAFVQVSSQSMLLEPKRHEAIRILRQAARTGGSIAALLQLASSLRAGPFGKVIENIDGLVAELRKTQADDVGQKDFCTQEFNENEVRTAARNSDKEDIEQNMADMASMVKQLSQQVTRLKEQVAETRIELKKASENREQENRDFQTTIIDQRATQQILKKALKRLKAFYGLQLKQEDIPEEMLQEGTHEKSSRAGGVLTMIEMIVEESKDVEQKAMTAESEAQLAYETFVKDSTASNKATMEEIGNKGQELAKLDGQTVTAQGDMAHMLDDLKTLDDYKFQLHSQCDDLIKNFSEIQQGRAEEIEALKSAKTVLESQR